MGKALVNNSGPLPYPYLLSIRLKAYRNGNWRHLTAVEKAFYKASLELAKLRGRIVNPSLTRALKTIISKLLQTAVKKILQMGGGRAAYLLNLYSQNRVVEWFPKIKTWLKDPEYLLWLGVKQMALKSLGYE